METFIKVLSAQMWLSSLGLYCWDFYTPQHLNEVTWFHSERTSPFPAASTQNLLLFKESLLICRTGKQNTNKKIKTNQPIKPQQTTQRPTLEHQEASPSRFYIHECLACHLVSQFQQAVWNLPAKFVLKCTKEVTIVSEVSSEDWEKEEVLCKEISLSKKHLNFNLIKKHEGEGKVFTGSELVELKIPETCKPWRSNTLFPSALQYFCKETLSSIVMQGTDFFLRPAWCNKRAEFLSHRAGIFY